MADNTEVQVEAPGAAKTPAADPMDMNTASAHDMLNWSDEEMERNMKIGLPDEESDGEPPADAILPAAQVEVPTQKPQEGTPVKTETPPETPEAKPTEPAPEPKPDEEPAKPIVAFKVFDKEGELDVPPDLTVTYDANGKTRENVPLDRVVRLAQMGEYNAEREESVLQSQQRVSQIEQQIAERDQRLDEYDKYFERILTDEAFRLTAIDSYAEQNTPEARLQRAEGELAARDTREREQNEIRRAAAFIELEVTPRVAQLIEQNPTVSFEEVMGRFNLLIAPLMVRGQVPHSGLPSVKQLVANDLTAWVTAKHQSNELDKKRTTNRVEAARTETTLAKRQLARAQQPAAASGEPPKPKLTDKSSAEDWFEATLPMPQSAP